MTHTYKYWHQRAPGYLPVLHQMAYRFKKLNVIYERRSLTLYRWTRGNSRPSPNNVTSLHRLQNKLYHQHGLVQVQLRSCYNRQMYSLESEESFQHVLSYSQHTSVSIYAYDTYRYKRPRNYDANRHRILDIPSTTTNATIVVDAFMTHRCIIMVIIVHAKVAIEWYNLAARVTGRNSKAGAVAKKLCTSYHEEGEETAQGDLRNSGVNSTKSFAIIVLSGQNHRLRKCKAKNQF